MRTTIQRKLIETTIHGVSFKLKDGQPFMTTLEPVVVYGNVDNETALRELKRVYGKHEAIEIKSIVSEEQNFEITVQDFIKHAKRVKEN